MEEPGFSMGVLLRTLPIPVQWSRTTFHLCSNSFLKQDSASGTIRKANQFNAMHRKVEVRPLSTPYYREIGLAMKERARLSPAAKKFLEYLPLREK